MSDPTSLSQALSELIALRGYARMQGDAQLQQLWAEVAGPEIAGMTRVLGLTRGVLQVAVASAALMSELNGFHKGTLLKGLRERRPESRIRELKFRLQSNLKTRARPNGSDSTGHPSQEGSDSV